MLWLYRLLFPPVMLLASPYYLARMKRRGGYGPNFTQRFGATPPLPPRRPGVRRVWLQAVSVGEMNAIAPILEGLRAAPEVEVYLTTTTSTGYKLARERYSSLTVAIGYFPLDWWPFSRRAWARIEPDLVILTEGERWPEHLAQARRRGVPVICINARMSDRGYRRLRRVRPLAGLLFDGVTRMLPCSERDAERFGALGVPEDLLLVTGNLKLDTSIPPLAPADRERLRRELGLGAGLVLLGSSTWAGEETALVSVLRAARDRGLPLSLLLVPRHAERREEVRALLRRAGVSFHFRSEGAAPGEVAVAVGDTTGELQQFTQLADLVFTGKSLAPHEGGQTPVEAAILGRPIVHGPRMSNFREISRSLDAAGASRMVDNASVLVATALELLGDAGQRERMSAAALRWSEKHRGAAARTLAVLREELAKLPA